MKIKTAELIGRQLDYAVALSAGGTGFRYDTIASYWITIDGKHYVLSNGWSEDQCYTPSTNWLRGGPIIEREKIDLEFMDNFEAWCGSVVREYGQDRESYSDDQDRESYTAEQESFVGYGPTPLIAVCRCYVASKMGDVVEVPEELT